VTPTTEFNLSATDGGLIPVGPNYTEYRIWNGTWSNWEVYTDGFTLGFGDGIRYVEFYSLDLLGNPELVQNETYIVDNTPPTTTIDVGSPKYVSGKIWVTSDTLFTLDATDDGLIPVGIDYIEYRVWNNGSWTSWQEYSSGFTLDVDEGMTHVEFYSIDKLGNTELVQNRSYIVDNTPPITTISVGDPKYKGDLGDIWNVTSTTTFTFSATDVGVGLNYTEYRIWSNGSWSEWYKYIDGFKLGSDNGTRYVEWYSIDFLGNKEMTHNETYFVDNIPPVTTYTLQLEDGETEARITLFATDVGSGVNFTKYRIGSGDWVTYSNTFVLNESGWHTIYFWSIDKLGNVENEKNFSVLIEEPGTTIPPSDGVKETNYKPLIALIFTIVLLVVGSIVSYKRPLNLKGEIKKNRLLTWLIVVLPFVIAEIITGVVSLFTGLLTVPPLLGAGMILDTLILLLGLSVFVIAYGKVRAS